MIPFHTTFLLLLISLWLLPPSVDAFPWRMTKGELCKVISAVKRSYHHCSSRCLWGPRHSAPVFHPPTPPNHYLHLLHPAFQPSFLTLCGSKISSPFFIFFSDYTWWDTTDDSSVGLLVGQLTHIQANIVYLDHKTYCMTQEVKTLLFLNLWTCPSLRDFQALNKSPATTVFQTFYMQGTFISNFIDRFFYFFILNSPNISIYCYYEIILHWYCVCTFYILLIKNLLYFNVVTAHSMFTCYLLIFS